MTAVWRCLVLAFVLGLVSSARAQEPMTSIRALLSLTPDEARERRPLRVEAVLLFNDRLQSVCFFHDGTASCFVGVPVPARDGLRLGFRYVVRGVSEAGGFKPIVIADQVAEIGPAVEPEPRRVATEEIFDTDLDAQWVEVEGRINNTLLIEGSPAIELAVPGSTLYGILPREPNASPSPPWHLLGRRARVRAIAAVSFNDERQMTRRYFYVPSLAAVVPIDAEPHVEAVETVATALLQPGSDPSQRVRVRGTVIHHLPGEAVFIRTASGCLKIRTAEPLVLVPGDEIESEGLPAMELHRPSLRATRVEKRGSGSPPKPILFSADARRRTSEQHELVTLEARILAVRDGLSAFVLQSRSGQELFDAQLDKRLASNLPTDLTVGSTVSLTGLCELQSSRFFNVPNALDGFRIQLRGAEDVAILARPSWWTTERLLGLAGGLALLGVAIGGWAFTLRRQVIRQTETIRARLARETILEERQRIAQDWHDTMEQQLMGVSMLVEDASARLTDLPMAADRLRLAERMLRHCRDDSRTSIRDLLSVALEPDGLASAFPEFLSPLAQSRGAKFLLELKGTSRRLPGRAEHQLLRIAQEAVANAAQHSGASEIAVTLEFASESVRLEVRDNGCGFTSDSIPNDGTHLGLSGMRERARRLGAALSILTSPGSGTQIVTMADYTALR